jgi:hypothetical protein
VLQVHRKQLLKQLAQQLFKSMTTAALAVA